MAKGIANRQKLAIRLEPSQRALKPRNPVAIAAKQRLAGAHKKSAAQERQALQRLLKRTVKNEGE